MSLRKNLFPILIAGLASTYCPAAIAQGADAASQNIGEKLNAAFGNLELFNSTAVEFVDNAKASFSCKWWVMKANQEHQTDIYELNTMGQQFGTSVIENELPRLQEKMLSFVLPALNKACMD